MTFNTLKFLRSVGKSSLLIVCLWLAVGPLAILQLGAWAWMLTSYSQESSIEQAFRETFGGDRPCELCRLIDSVEEKQDESTPLPPKNDYKSLKLMLGLERAVRVPVPHSSKADRIFETWLYRSVGQQVPTPPPRSLV
ncbi:MAG: hypothetical protein AAF065_07605 [Verrucomicrobiota bacterium]